MADAVVTLHAGEQGVFEELITGGQALQVVVEDGDYQNLQVIHHDGDRPLYVGLNRQLAPRDPEARIVLPGTWLIVTTGESAGQPSLWLVSASDVTASVVRT